jgi:hypothetical protein
MLKWICLLKKFFSPDLKQLLHFHYYTAKLIQYTVAVDRPIGRRALYYSYYYYASTTTTTTTTTTTATTTATATAAATTTTTILLQNTR